MLFFLRRPNTSPRLDKGGQPRLGKIASLALCFLVLPVSELEGQANDVNARPTVEATRIADGSVVQIDGRLDEEVWRQAVPITDFRQQDPVEGGVPSEPTEIRLLYDSQALYIGAMFYDSEPEGILAHQLERNAGLGTDDRFMWILDTFRDGRTGYFFEINPAGLMGDGLIGGGGGINKRWDGIWEVRTQIRSDGWSAEIRIPFSTLNFDPQRDTWGINFQRTIRRKSEEILWSGWRRNESLFRPASAGELRGLERINQGLGVEVKPYVLADGNQSPSLGTPWDTNAKTGLDVSYSVTPSLRAGVTVNTDFAEVEVDARRVNLTRFPLRFPEQRGFFLEGSGVHSFSWADPFFSRRIGLVQGQEVPIRYGARLGGQAGRYEMGFYQIRTGETALESEDLDQLWPTEDFTVGRVRRSLFQQSHVGAVYTRRATAFDPLQGSTSEAPVDRHTAGGDFNFYTSEALGRYNAQIEGFMIFHTDPTGEAGFFSPDYRARGYRWNLPNDIFRLHSSYRDFGPGWDPAVGFAQRRGFRRHQPTLTIAPRPQWLASVRQTEHQFYFEYLTDWDNRVLYRQFRLQPLQVNFESGDRFSFQVGREFERLERTFPIHGSEDDAVVIPAGDYDAWGWSVGGQTAGRRILSGALDVGRSDFWDGERTEFDLRGTVRPRRGVSVTTEYQRNEVRLEQGDFNTNLVRLSGSWNLSPLTSFTGNVQYDDVSRVVGLFARARWIVRPGSDVFLVWTHNWQNEVARLLDREFTTLSRGGAIKVNYSFRF